MTDVKKIDTITAIREGRVTDPDVVSKVIGRFEQERLAERQRVIEGLQKAASSDENGEVLKSDLEVYLHPIIAVVVKQYDRVLSEIADYRNIGKDPEVLSNLEKEKASLIEELKTVKEIISKEESVVEAYLKLSERDERYKDTLVDIISIAHDVGNQKVIDALVNLGEEFLPTDYDYDEEFEESPLVGTNLKDLQKKVNSTEAA